MYFWKTHLLVEELSNGGVDQRTLKNYYMAASIFSLISFYFALFMPHESYSYAFAFEGIGSIVATIFGLNAAFDANGGATGSRFLDKVIAISFPLIIKIFLAGCALGFLSGILEGAKIMSKGQLDWVFAVVQVVVLIVFFWRLVGHVKKTNT